MCIAVVLMFLFVYCMLNFIFFKQKTAYEMRISDWSSDVCSSDLDGRLEGREFDSKLGSRSRTHLIQKTTASLCARSRGRIRIGDQCEQYVDRKIGRASLRERECQDV